MRPLIVLSLFPGIGMLDYAFELEGFQIVRGPDYLWGGDIRQFHVRPGYFDGVIGGPPCPKHSKAKNINGTKTEDLIPEFVRIVNEAAPTGFVVMENVLGAMRHPSIPSSWFVSKVRDFDCGGHTHRTRAFFTWPFMFLTPPYAAGKAEHSVMASTYRRGSSDNQYCKDKGFLPGDLPIEEYARLQGAEVIGQRLIEHRASRAFSIHVLGNGVPIPMGRLVARAAREAMQ